MKVFDSHAALYTDYCQLVMAQGYFLSGKTNTTAVFDYSFRENPFGNGYVVFAGLSAQSAFNRLPVRPDGAFGTVTVAALVVKDMSLP